MITIVLASIMFVVVAVASGLMVLRPIATSLNDRARIRREAVQASWTIHRLASDAFAQMLDAARQAQQNQEGGRKGD